MRIHFALVAALPLTAALRAVEPAAEPDVDQALQRGVAALLERQEGDARAEWPYEGVYRVAREIPYGYRVGGTAIVCEALLAAPGVADDADRRAAIDRATAFIAASIDEPSMAHDVQSTYDVRGWGWAYGLAHLVRVKQAFGAEAIGEAGEKAIAFFLAGIEKTLIPEHGGWNYARRAGFQKPGAPSPFMTSSTLQALMLAHEAGYAVPDALVTAGLDALESARTPSGSYMYAGSTGATSRESVPGSVGRMLCAEVVLLQGGRGSAERVRAALDAFLVHWEWLEKRRAQDGTHVPPYGIAPYYFYYAHYYAAQAVAALPRQERGEYGRLVRERIFRTRAEDGTWNDRVFPRSAAYGTAMCMSALLRLPADAPAEDGRR